MRTWLHSDKCNGLSNRTYQNTSIVLHNVWVWELTKQIYFLSIQKNKSSWSVHQTRNTNTVIFIKPRLLINQLKWITSTQYNFLICSFESASICISLIAQKSPPSLHCWTKKVMHVSKHASKTGNTYQQYGNLKDD